VGEFSLLRELLAWLEEDLGLLVPVVLVDFPEHWQGMMESF